MSFSVKRIFDVFQIAVLVYSVYWLSRYIASENIINWFAEINIFIFLLVLAQRLLPYIFLGYRFSILTRRKIPTPRAVAGEIMCVGFNNILPARFGEVLKLFYFRRLSNLPLTKLIAYVFVERITDVFFLLALGTVITFHIIPKSYSFMFIGIMFLQILILTDRKNILIKMSVFLLKNNFISLIRIAHNFYYTVRCKVYLKAVGVSILMWLMNLIHIFMVCYLFLNMNLPVSNILILFVIVFSAGIFPIPGGIGVVDAGIFTFLTFYLNYPEHDSLKTAFFLRLFYSIPAIFGMLLTNVEYIFRCRKKSHINNSYT